MGGREGNTKRNEVRNTTPSIKPCGRGHSLFLECPLMYIYMELTKLFFEDLKSQNYGLCWKGP